MEDLYKHFGLQPGCQAEDFNEGRLLLLDKPMGWSSFDLANKVRYLIKQQLGFKKIKVGHAGTLDPLATGLMIVCTGRLTKQIETLMGMDKEYVATITLGGTTPSYDLETEPDGVFETGHIGVPQIEAALKGFLGQQMQTPPLFSAIRINGKRAYEHARKGHDVVLSQREVVFKELELIGYDRPVAKIRVVCSKGTYIRSFANDLGKALQSGGHLSGLVRTAIGPFKLTGAQSVAQFELFLKDFRTI
jgi:tRNA pseudouridine55 synthase